MHSSARDFVAHTLHDTRHPRVVEVGGRDINGGVRDLVAAEEYLSLDLVDGPAVDVVADCRDWSPPWPADLVICCEVLEHAADPAGVLAACIGYLRPGGLLLVTCAGPGRKPHSGADGGPVRQGEHYANIDPSWLGDLLGADLDGLSLEYRAGVCDIYATGRRK